MYVAVLMLIFLCVARTLPFQMQDAQESSKPSKHQKVKNMGTACHPGQLCVIFGVCFQLKCVNLSGCLAASTILFSGGSLLSRAVTKAFGFATG